MLSYSYHDDSQGKRVIIRVNIADLIKDKETYILVRDASKHIKKINSWYFSQPSGYMGRLCSANKCYHNCDSNKVEKYKKIIAKYMNKQKNYKQHLEWEIKRGRHGRDGSPLCLGCLLRELYYELKSIHNLYTSDNDDKRQDGGTGHPSFKRLNYDNLDKLYL